jgi:hypothetical protein
MGTEQAPLVVSPKKGGRDRAHRLFSKSWPAGSIGRWTARRRAEVLITIRNGEITRSDAQRRTPALDPMKIGFRRRRATLP